MIVKKKLSQALLKHSKKRRGAGTVSSSSYLLEHQHHFYFSNYNNNGSGPSFNKNFDSGMNFKIPPIPKEFDDQNRVAFQNDNLKLSIKFKNVLNSQQGERDSLTSSGDEDAQPTFSSGNQSPPQNQSYSGSSSSTFVSSYYQVKPHEIIDFIEQRNFPYKFKNQEIILKYCPICPKPHHNDPSNLNTCQISSVKGFYNCFRCQQKGSWYDFKNKVLMSIYGQAPSQYVYHQDNKPVQKTASSQNDYVNFHLPAQNQTQSQAKYDIVEAYNTFFQLKKNLLPTAVDYLTGTQSQEQRHLKKEVLEAYRVGVGQEKFRNDKDQIAYYDCVYFPLYAPASKKKKKKASEQPQQITNNKVVSQIERETCEEEMNTSECELVKMKIRAIGSENKHRMKMAPQGSELKGLFGLNIIRKEDRALVITEGEYDAMAVHQQTGLPAISLPNGANHMPLQFLPFLERFERIYLWLDADQVGLSSAEKIAQKLGMKRTIIIDSRLHDENGPKDANDALRMGLNFKKIFEENCINLGEENILTVESIKNQIIERMKNYKLLQGVPALNFNFYNKTIKGFRKGELTVLTGATGSGKTTFLSQLSLEFLQQGIPTLWGSFEIKNEILATTMLQQFTKKKLTNKSLTDIEQAFVDFESKPLYFLNFYGSTPLDLLFATLDYAIYAYDIQNICLDNMQFMLSNQVAGSNKFDYQDKVISMLRQLATDRMVQISLIIHPKKVDDDTNLNVASIFGSAKVTQEADNVMILQKGMVPNYRIIQVKKNRFDGETGDANLVFNYENKRYFEITKDESIMLISNSGGTEKIIKERIKKFGSVEPDPNDFKQKQDKKIETTHEPITQNLKTSKVLASSDIEFHAKLRGIVVNDEEPEENFINSKARHTFQAEASADQDSDDGDGNDGNDGDNNPDTGIGGGIDDGGIDEGDQPGDDHPIPDQEDERSLDYQQDMLNLDYERQTGPLEDMINLPDEVELSDRILSQEIFLGSANTMTDENRMIGALIQQQINKSKPSKKVEAIEQPSIDNEQRIRIQEHFEQLESQSLEQIAVVQKKQYYNQSQFNLENDDAKMFKMISKRSMIPSMGRNIKIKKDYSDNQYSQKKDAELLQQMVQQQLAGGNIDKYDNPPLRKINIQDALHPFVSPELKRNIIPFERTYVYTKQATKKSNAQGDDEDSNISEIAITKDQYERAQTILKPKYLREHQMLKQESFYEEFNSIESLTRQKMEIGSQLTPNARILKSKTEQPSRQDQELRVRSSDFEDALSSLEHKQAMKEQSQTQKNIVTESEQEISQIFNLENDIEVDEIIKEFQSQKKLIQKTDLKNLLKGV